MAITEKTIKDLNDFIKAGEQSAANSVNEALEDSDLKTSFRYLIEEAERAENTIITKYMNKEILNKVEKDGKIDLNEIIKKIDDDFGYKYFLPLTVGGVEDTIGKTNNLKITSKNAKKSEQTASNITLIGNNNNFELFNIEREDGTIETIT